MYIHVKFKLCIFRNRFLNISNKDHVGIHYHILHWSMCYIFITRRACKTNHTLWIMPCFSRQICKVWDPRHSLLLGAGGSRGCSSTPHSASSAGGSHFQEWGVLKRGSYFRCYWLFWCYFGYFRPRASAGSSLFVPRALPGWCCLGKVLGFLEGLSASGKPLGFHLTILHFPPQTLQG